MQFPSFWRQVNGESGHPTHDQSGHCLFEIIGPCESRQRGVYTRRSCKGDSRHSVNLGPLNATINQFQWGGKRTIDIGRYMLIQTATIVPFLAIAIATVLC